MTHFGHSVTEGRRVGLRMCRQEDEGAFSLSLVKILSRRGAAATQDDLFFVGRGFWCVLLLLLPVLCVLILL